jgi:hypothetical protein
MKVVMHVPSDDLWIFVKKHLPVSLIPYLDEDIYPQSRCLFFHRRETHIAEVRSFSILLFRSEWFSEFEEICFAYERFRPGKKITLHVWETP